MSEAPTGQTVRGILIAAGFQEWSRGVTSGFHIGEGGTEVLVEHLRTGSDADSPFTDAVKASILAALDRYSAALTAAGFRNDRAWRTHGPWMIVILKDDVTGWIHADGTACPGYLAPPASTPAGGYWCTTHQMFVRHPDSPAAALGSRHWADPAPDADADFADEWDDEESSAYQDRAEAGLEPEGSDG